MQKSFKFLAEFNFDDKKSKKINAIYVFIGFEVSKIYQFLIYCLVCSNFCENSPTYN